MVAKWFNLPSHDEAIQHIKETGMETLHLDKQDIEDHLVMISNGYHVEKVQRRRIKWTSVVLVAAFVVLGGWAVWG